MISLEEKTGKSFLELAGELQNPKKVKMSLIRDLIWGALLHEDKNLKIDETTDILDCCEMMILINKLQEAIELAMRDPEENGGNAEAGATESQEKVTPA